MEAKRVKWSIKKLNKTEQKGLVIKEGTTVAQDGKKLVFRKKRRGKI